MASGSRIVAVDELPDETTFLFTVRELESDEEKEAILVRLNGEVSGWLNYCQHWTDVHLDRGDGTTMHDGDIVCTKHGATFAPDTGYCDFGPCEGAYLTGVDVTVEDGAVYLTDEAYEFLETGRSNGDDLDLSTSPGERLGF